MLMHVTAASAPNLLDSPHAESRCALNVARCNRRSDNVRRPFLDPLWGRPAMAEPPGKQAKGLLSELLHLEDAICVRTANGHMLLFATNGRVAAIGCITTQLYVDVDQDDCMQLSSSRVSARELCCCCLVRWLLLLLLLPVRHAAARSRERSGARHKRSFSAVYHKPRATAIGAIICTA